MKKSIIDWNGLELYYTSLQGATLQASAKKYLKECGASDAECESLRLIFSGEK